ncbi:MAG: hypothetical protein NWE83_05635 [Candidatus Bathyarchaeota archaeon]|jgi:hypothetical protein|nr:hypothetical protein [Candidatus Bathyarchaeota archaeon]
MTESNHDEKKDPKTSKVVLKSVKIKRSNRVIRSRRPKPVSSHDQHDTVDTPSLHTPTIISEEVPSASSPPEIVSIDSNQPANPTLWKGALQSSQSSFSFFDRIFQPNIQYKLFLLFLSIWGASFIMFYLSTTFAIILPEPFNLVVLGFFLISTSLSGIYTFLLGLQHFRNTRQTSDDSYY